MPPFFASMASGHDFRSISAMFEYFDEYLGTPTIENCKRSHHQLFIKSDYTDTRATR